jgi:RNA polymerase sigma-70 factor (ECF subfamily)
MELPAKYREVILLYYYEGYSIGEIARILGQKESTVGSQLHRARKKLRLLISGEDGNGRI